MRLKNIHKILFITLSNIGDVILTLPVLSALRDNFPGAIIDVVSGPRPEKIFEKDPRVSRVFVYDKYAGLNDKMRFIKKLRREKYDLAIDMKTSLLPVLIGARYRTSMIICRDRSRPFPTHKRLVHLEKLRPLGIIYKEQKNIYIDGKSRQEIEKVLKDNGIDTSDILIGISPASRSHLKEWRRAGFIEVINEILRKPGYKVVLIGDINETKLSQEIKDRVKHPGLVDLTGKTHLSQVFALIERLNLLLTCDSASMHIASDLGVRVAAIFGPTDPEEYGPRGEKDIVIRKKLECSPCKKAQCRLGTHECMETISAEEVLEAIRKIVPRTI